ncbi:MAG: sigma-70 family RNA polymerase sigma factor [Deltaproteobacteria bacterium]|nr:sigma-70 family RNA polymerase sigma factor [Deltaproteobacteria bacterium]
MATTERDTATTFEAERRHLFGVAYRMLGTAAEAEDVLQDAWLRFAESPRAREAESPRAYLTTIVVRLCLDHMKSARARRETYVGPWLPEPIVSMSSHDPEEGGADARIELAESLSIAFLVVLERLTPLERAAFLLREVFDRPFEEVATTLETSEAACRQLVSRARAHVSESRPRSAPSEEKKRELFQAFLGACASNDPAALAALLADDVVMRSDGGGKVHAALKPVHGRDRVTRFLLGVLKRGVSKPGYGPASIGTPRFVYVNGQPGVVVGDDEGDKAALTVSFDGDLVSDVFIVVNPEKLRSTMPPSSA